MGALIMNFVLLLGKENGVEFGTRPGRVAGLTDIVDISPRWKNNPQVRRRKANHFNLL